MRIHLQFCQLCIHANQGWLTHAGNKGQQAVAEGFKLFGRILSKVLFGDLPKNGMDKMQLNAGDDD